MSSCVIRSFYPFFKEKDIIEDKRFEGSWLDVNESLDTNHLSDEESSKGTPTWEFKSSKNSFKLKIKNTIGPDNYTDFKVTPFELDGHKLLNFEIADIESEYALSVMHILTVHTIAEYRFSGDTLTIGWFSSSKFKEIFKKNRARIDHIEHNNDVLLTAKTEDLQRFILKYIDLEEFSPSDGDYLKLVRKR